MTDGTRRHLVRNWLHELRKAWSDRATVRRERDRQRLGVAEADGARRQFRWDQAVEGYRAYLATRPRDAAVVVRLAQTLTAAGRLAEARAALETGLRLRPTSGALRRATAELERVEETVVEADAPDLWTSDLPIAPRLDVRPAGTVLRAEAGVTVLPQARDWLEYALVTTGAAAVYGDHRRGAGRGGELVLHGAAHPEDLATTPHPPVLILFSPSAAPDDATPLRRAVIDAFGLGAVAHVPLVLAEVQATAATPADAPAIGSRVARDSEARILVVVPTRDEGRMLRAMVDSLLAMATHPDRVDVVVIDNGSGAPETLAMLAGWRANGDAQVLRIDEPFNWSDLNNRAAFGRTQDILLFINNDMVMRSAGWDERLRRHLAEAGIGVVGARLLYPAGNVQHAGLALGVVDAGGAPCGPLHEGLGATAEDHGPLDRWVRNRPAAAVTGAFLAVRREVFEAVGGFDAVHFPVSCNDVDFCLRVRERGLTVLYAADIELTHDESHTRGHDDSEERKARATAEKAALVRLWGEDASRDPSRNPHWVAHDALIFHRQARPDRNGVLAWIARGGDIWRTRRGG